MNINRWLGDRRAAFSITNDADGETYDRLAAIYYGSNDPESHLYLQQGIIANNIRISHTTFGENHPLLKDIHDDIIQYGNSIGYHTFANLEDPPGTNAQALLHDMQPYNIRLWIDHSLPNNPEGFGWNGLQEGSPNYIGDVINQTNIKYAWMADTPSTDPFNAFNDPWRLPHRLYEISSLQKPVWFFGRTRTQAWEYLSGNITLDMKNRVTPENLDQLLLERGLNICYTHFCFSNWTGVNSFYIVEDDGEHRVRPEVEDMLRMLNHYQLHRGLWIDTVENIFDRMLAIEELKVVRLEYPSCGKCNVTLINGSDYPLDDIYLQSMGQEIRIPLLDAGSEYSFSLDIHSNTAPYISRHNFCAYYSGSEIYIKDKLNPGLDPARVSIYNIKGQKVREYESRYKQAVLIVPGQNLASGEYLVRLNFSGTGSYIMKLSVVK